MSQEIFRKIQSAALAADSNFLADEQVRWIERQSEEDAKLMSEASINVLPLGQNILAASIANGDDNFICFSGFSPLDHLPDGLIAIDATPGLFSCVIFSSDIPVTGTPSEIRNVLEGQYRGVDDYNGHKLENIESLFPKLLFFRLDKNSDAIYLNNLERVAGSFFARGYNGYPLSLNFETINSIIDIFECGPDSVPYGMLLQGLLSYSWPAFYLDLYRCLEQLYSAPKLQRLAEILIHTGSLADLAYTLENILAWRPKEEEALSALLLSIRQETREKIVSSFCRGESNPPEATGEKCANRVYKLRNTHVHFRPAMTAAKLSPEQWNLIISTMCEVVSEVYSEFGARFLTKAS